MFGLLAAAPEARLVRHLDLSDSRCGDAGVDELITSGLIARLAGLDLSRCAITDDGATALADCPDVPKLKTLRLDGNDLSPIGAAALARVGVTHLGPQRFLPDHRVEPFED